MSLGTILLIVLVIALLGGFSGLGGGPFYGTGYYGGGRTVVRRQKGSMFSAVQSDATGTKQTSQPERRMPACSGKAKVVAYRLAIYQHTP
jgi:hypothetical protein